MIFFNKAKAFLLKLELIKKKLILIKRKKITFSLTELKTTSFVVSIDRLEIVLFSSTKLLITTVDILSSEPKILIQLYININIS